MGSAERQKREKFQLQKLVLDTARQIIHEEGYDSLTIREIAARIEYSPMALYNHFADKNEILHALAREAFEKIERVLPKPGKDPIATLRQAMLAYIEFGIKHHEEYQLVFMTRRTDDPDAPAPVDSPDSLPDHGGKEAFLRLIGYIEACMSSGHVQGESFSLAKVIWAGIHGCVALQITQIRFPFGKKRHFAESVVDTLIRGITA